MARVVMLMGAVTVDPFKPDQTDIEVASAALPRISAYLRRHPHGPQRVSVIVEEDGAELVVPRGAVELLTRILSHIAVGQSVSVVPADTELTTQQAADLLNVSRPYLIGLLEAGEIDYRLVGRHRRVKLTSLLDYKRSDDQRRRAAADELAQLTQEMEQP